MDKTINIIVVALLQEFPALNRGITKLFFFNKHVCYVLSCYIPYDV